jgi:hypothetical protein
MFIHIFAFRWKPVATDAQKQRAATDICDLKQHIPQVLEVHVGNNVSARAQDYAFGGVMKFNTHADYETYAGHPAHLALLAWLGPLIDPLELDFEA